MKALGIVRKLDELGRVVIPMEIRKANGWAANQPMEFFVGDEGLLIKPYGKDAERRVILDELEHLQSNTGNEEVVRIAKKAIEFLKNQGE